MIKIDLVTGFLGSGKTTFLKKYAEYLALHGYQVGIIENDFGAVNVDMLMLQDLLGDRIDVELAQDKFIQTVVLPGHNFLDLVREKLGWGQSSGQESSSC